MTGVIIYWIALGLLGFGFALAVQMRIMIALVLRRALLARHDQITSPGLANEVIIQAARPADAAIEQRFQLFVDHLRQDYSKPLSHLHLARRYSYLLPGLILIWLVLGRLVFGVI